MKYYKLIKDSVFVGIGSDLDMRRYQQKHGIVITCDVDRAEYIQVDGKLYHSDWMLPEPTSDTYIEVVHSVDVIEITENEYNILQSAIDKGEDINVDGDDYDEQEQEENITNPEQEVTVEYVRKKKIAEMSTTCNSVITSGFDVQLSDGKNHHFSLSTQDQLNLITLTALVNAGEQNIPYHADGELCVFYSPLDVIAITTAATNFKTYHVSYFNSLKLYIESMDDIEKINAVTYGIQIPNEYMSNVLKAIMG